MMLQISVLSSLHLLMGKLDPFAVSTDQGISEECCILERESTRLADSTLQRPANKLNTEALNNLVLVVVVIHFCHRVWVFLELEDVL